MTQPFLGQIQPYSFNWAPRYWAQCDGALLSIQQNAALFSLLGTYYGGNGTTNFALPDMRGRVPLSQGVLNGASYPIGMPGGSSSVTLQIGQIPQHTHMLMGVNGSASSGGAGRNPAAGSALANSTVPSGTPDNFYGAATALQPLEVASVSPYGSGQPHDNMQPYLAINWCIALSGIFPTRN